jgi:diguanylate cyclase (GGDEF)-like protein
VAMLSTPVTTLSLRLQARLQAWTESMAELQGLFQAILSAAPEPGLIVYTDGGQVIHASDSFFKRMLLDPRDILGKKVFEVIAVTEPEQVRHVLHEHKGEVPFCVYRVGTETRIANLHFHRTEHRGTAYTYVGLQELTDLYYLRSAFDAIGDPLMVIGSDRQLLYANRATQEVFGAVHFGMDVRSSPAVARVVDDWSRYGERAGQVRIRVDDQPYDASGVVARLSGRVEACTILWLHSAAREEALFNEAVRDALTGLYNRRYFNDALPLQLAHVRRGAKLTCAYVDLDHFKTINDTLGHAGGDAALVAFTEAVKRELRSTDVFARLGGDEFAILFSGTEAPVAAKAIERVYQRLAREPFVFNGQRLPLNFSAGLTGCRPEDSIEELMARADRALYAAKESGRGGAVVAE